MGMGTERTETQARRLLQTDQSALQEPFHFDHSSISMIRPSPYIRCFSSIFCQQEDKSELQGATLNFLPSYSRKACRGLVTSKFTGRSEQKNHFFFSYFLPYGYSYQLLLLYPDFSGSRQSALLESLLYTGFQTGTLKGLLPHRGRLLLHPEGLCILKQTVLRYVFLLMVSIFP